MDFFLLLRAFFLPFTSEVLLECIFGAWECIFGNNQLVLPFKRGNGKSGPLLAIVSNKVFILGIRSNVALYAFLVPGSSGVIKILIGYIKVC